jgi:hypothetical protein
VNRLRILTFAVTFEALFWAVAAPADAVEALNAAVEVLTAATGFATTVEEFDAAGLVVAVRVLVASV